MKDLNFYTVDLNYVQYLKAAEQEKRGFSRVPDLDYGSEKKQKFLCGIVLQVNGTDYYVPVSSYKQQRPDNFLLRADNGDIVGSLRFNYMFPVPKELTEIRQIASEPDQAYRSMLSQELRYCVKNQDQIRFLAERTYKRVLMGKDRGLTLNSCDFPLLEQQHRVYCQLHDLTATLTSPAPADEISKPTMADRMAAATEEADRRSGQSGAIEKKPEPQHGE